MLALAATWQAIVAFVSFERLGKARDAPRDAIIAEGTKRKRRGRGFGIHQMMDTTGAIIGTLLVLFLFWRLQLGFKTIIIIAGAISVLSLLPLIWVKEPKFKLIKLSLLKGLHLLDKKLKYFIFVASIFTLGNFGLYMFLILLAKQVSNSTVIALALYVLFSFMYAVFAIPFGKLSDKIGRKKVLMIGYVLFLGVAFALIHLTSILYVTLFFALYGVVFAITQSNSRALVSDLAKKMKGTALGSYYAITGLVNIPAGLIAGLLWDLSPATMFSYISAVAFVSIVLLGFVREK
jgi:MFS family permease